MKTTDLRRERELKRQEGYRETILHAAERVILRQGFSSTTMDDVAREARLSKATLYKYVPSKGALLFEIMGHYFDDIRDALAGLVAEPASAGEKFRRAIRMILEYNADKENMTRVLWMDNALLKLMRIFVVSTGRPGSSSATFRRALAMLRQKRNEVTEMGARILEEGVASGEFRPLDVPAALAFIDAVLQGYAHNRFWEGGGGAPAGVPSTDAESLARFILEGIRNPERPVKEN